MVHNNQVIMIFLICRFDFFFSLDILKFILIHCLVVCILISLPEIQICYMMDNGNNSIALTMASNQCKNIFFVYVDTNHKLTKALYIFLSASNIETSCATFNGKWTVKAQEPVLFLLKAKSEHAEPRWTLKCKIAFIFKLYSSYTCH